jgi:hypothetical protein
MQKQQTNTETPEFLTFEYLQEARWYYLRAENPNENLVSALHRMKAGNLKTRMEMLGILVPTSTEIYNVAKEYWPAHKLHAEEVS